MFLVKLGEVIFGFLEFGNFVFELIFGLLKLSFGGLFFMFELGNGLDEVDLVFFSVSHLLFLMFFGFPHRLFQIPDFVFIISLYFIYFFFVSLFCLFKIFLLL